MFNPFKNWSALFDVSANHRSSLDAWRAIAMYWIVTKHSMQVIMAYRNTPQVTNSMLENQIYKPIFLAEFGVDVFFVLSGYLIGLILLKELGKTGRIDVWRFYIRRALRMFPIYYFILIVIVVLRYFKVANNLWPTSDAWPNFFYLNNFIEHKNQFLVFTWSLAIEEQFYIFCPLLFLVIKRFNWKLIKVLSFLIIASIAIHYLIIFFNDLKIFWIPFPFLDRENYTLYFDLLYDKPYIRFSSLFIGVIGSYLSLKGWDKKMFSTTASTCIALFAGVLLIFLTFFFQDYSGPIDIGKIIYECVSREIFSVGFIILVFASLNVEFISKVFSFRFFFPLFQLSYGIYLVHALVLRFFVRNDNLFNIRELMNLSSSSLYFYLFGALIFLLSGIIVIPIYVLIERPFMNIREKYFPATRPFQKN